ncbi:DUF4160 domain-containing protein [Deltaproteobacteria bacterium TL4]
MIEGDLPHRSQKMIKEWASVYQRELTEMWKSQEFRNLPGLE